MGLSVSIPHPASISVFLSSHLSKAAPMCSQACPKLTAKWDSEFMEGLWRQRLLKSPWESLMFWYWLYSWSRVKKIRVSSRRKFRFYYVNRSLKALWENTAAKRDPHRSQGGAMQERKETWITQSNNCQEVKTTNSPFWLRNLSGCTRVQVEPQASTNLTWKETHHWTYTKLIQNQFSFRFFPETFKTHNTVFWYISPLWQIKRYRISQNAMMWSHISSLCTIQMQHPQIRQP